ncbi:hypothetical protein JCM8097_004534 [Rhodosporidiobolus ruineniae]
MADPPISLLPPELLYRILELTVDGLPGTLRIRSTILRSFALVAQAWREPAQILLESRVQIDSHHRAKAFLERPRRLERPLVLEELTLFFDFMPDDDEAFPLTHFMARSICEMKCQIRFLHLRSALFTTAFDTSLLLLPSFRDLRHLKLDLLLEPPTNTTPLPLRFTKLSLSSMMDQPTTLFRTLLPNSVNTLTTLHIFVTQNGSPLHERLLDVVPSLSSTLRHLSISTHWVAFSESLFRFITSCTNLATLTFSGVQAEQIHSLFASLPATLSAFDLTVPSGPPIALGDDPVTLLTALLAAPCMRQCRFASVLKRAEKGRPLP